MNNQKAGNGNNGVLHTEFIAADLERLPKRTPRIPAHPISHVSRPRLIDTLNAGLNRGCRLTLLCSPAGYGKTTTAIEWMSLADRTVAWVNSCPPRISPRRFWIEVIRTLYDTNGFLDSGLSNLLQSGVSPIDLPNVLTTLIHQLEVLPEPLFLVIDDYRASKALDSTLLYFINRLPSQVHLVMTMRAEIGLPLARLRLNREVMEIGVQELSFTEQETYKLLVEIMDLHLSLDQVKALQSKTEGWVAALLLAASRLEQQSDAYIDTFIASLSGGPRFVLDYLREEALSNLPRDSRRFLREVSILKRMNASLCDAVTGRQNSRQILDKLERTNLFVQPLDDDRLWYRCHGLVAKTLMTEFEQSDPERFRDSHIKASEWCSAHGLADEAFNHALAASDYERCADIIEREHKTLWRHGEIGLISEWLACLPEEVVNKRPFLTLSRAAILVSDCQLDLAKLRIARAEKELNTDDSNLTSNESWLKSWALIMRASISYMGEDYPKALDLIQQLATSPYTDPTALLHAYLLGGIIESHIGNTERAMENLSRSLAIAQEMGDIFTTSASYYVLGDVLILDGRLREAHDLCLKALKSSEDNRTAALFRWKAEVNLARVCYEWDQLEAAKHVLSLNSRNAILQPIDAAALSHMWLVKAKLDLLPLDTNVLWDGDKLPLDPGTLDTVRANQLLILLWQGRMTDADVLVRRLRVDEIKPSISNAPLLLAYAQWLIVHHNIYGAIHLLRDLENKVRVDRYQGLYIQIRLLQSLAIYSADDIEHALVPLQQALTMAETESYVRSFLDLGKPIEMLLRLSLDRGLSIQCVTKLLNAFEHQAQWSPGHPAQIRLDVIPEPLSRRELETLRLLAGGASYQEIADILCVSLSTVGSHTQAIYRKLDVHSSAKAITKAAKLGLLTPPILPT